MRISVAVWARREAESRVQSQSSGPKGDSIEPGASAPGLEGEGKFQTRGAAADRLNSTCVALRGFLMWGPVDLGDSQALCLSPSGLRRRRGLSIKRTGTMAMVGESFRCRNPTIRPGPIQRPAHERTRGTPCRKPPVLTWSVQRKNEDS